MGRLYTLFKNQDDDVQGVPKKIRINIIMLLLHIFKSVKLFGTKRKVKT